MREAVGPVRPDLDGPGRRPPHGAGPDLGLGSGGRSGCFSGEIERRLPGPKRGGAPRPHGRRQWARQAPVQPCPAWVTKPPRPLLGDVRVGGSGGRGGGAATTAAFLEGGRMYGAAGPPARSASAPLVRSLRRPPPPTAGSVEKGCGRGAALGRGWAIRRWAGGRGRGEWGDTCPGRRLAL